MTTIECEEPTAAVKLPPRPPVPKALQGLLGVANRTLALQVLRRRYGPAFTLNMPIFGPIVVLSDRDDIRQVFKTAPDVADTTEANLGRVMGSNSMFALYGDQH